MDKCEIKVTPAGQELTIRQGEAERIYQYNGYHYDAYSTDSFISLVIAKAIADNAVVAYTEKGIEAILDDRVINRDKDRVSYTFKYSQQYTEWFSILNGTTIDQKTLLKFLQRRETGEIDNIDSLMIAIQQVKFAKTTSGESAIVDNNNYVFAIQVGEAEGTTRIPQIITANIEIYNESGFKQPMEIEVEINLPSRQEEKLTFGLSCPKLSRYLREAVKHEIETVKAGLDSWLIVTGKI